MRALLLLLALVAPRPAAAGDLAFGYPSALEAGQEPSLTITPQRDVARLQVRIEAGHRDTSFDHGRLPAGTAATFSWPRDTSVTRVTAHLLVDFADGSTEEFAIPLSYTYGGRLGIDLSNARADVRARTLTVEVDGPVDRAVVKAYGARRALLAEQAFEMDAGPGEIRVPWVGAASEVVLLDVTLHSGGAWSGFTYSPWFLDIPHDDVRFASGSDVVPPGEEPKLVATLARLREVIEQYGDVVPVKLFIAGCTDTVGTSASNRDLSRRRARAIAAWLRRNGYDRPIFYHGFGEEFLAVDTGDDVDEPRNRRAVYVVGANPPPPGSGVPQVEWTPL